MTAVALFASTVVYAEDQAPSLMPQQRLVVLQQANGDIPAALMDEVDRSLAGAVAARVPGASLYVSPVPFEDVELAAGCSGQAQEVDCLQRIAGSLGADWLLVRELRKDRTGKVRLTLVAHDGPQAIVTRRAVASVAVGKQAPAQVVPTLIERLYPGQSTGDRPFREERSLSPANVVGWSSTAVGGGLLAAGITMGVLSRRDHDKYERTEVRTPADADRAYELLDRSQQRARVANGLLIGGAGAGAAGALALLWKYIRPKPDAEQPVRMGVAPYRGGFKVSVTGAWRGRL
ncbi:MAG TPA: hypothetical protein VFX59_09550 [Polyangiales bacterium]|nr:hypothetical protein [Polyangiales bacterium]